MNSMISTYLSVPIYLAVEPTSIKKWQAKAAAALNQSEVLLYTVYRRSVVAVKLQNYSPTSADALFACVCTFSCIAKIVDN